MNIIIVILLRILMTDSYQITGHWQYFSQEEGYSEMLIENDSVYRMSSLLDYKVSTGKVELKDSLIMFSHGNNLEIQFSLVKFSNQEVQYIDDGDTISMYKIPLDNGLKKINFSNRDSLAFARFKERRDAYYLEHDVVFD